MDWVDSMGDEYYGLVKRGVFDTNDDKGYTKAELEQRGITSKPVPCAPYFENKYGAEGELTKKKTRVAVQGHSGNMQKNVHYKETFSFLQLLRRTLQGCYVLWWCS